jgi:CRISPR system Cascade subunit CasB
MASAETAPGEASGEQASGARDGFMRSLVELAEQEDRGALARLRRTAGKSPAEAFEAYRYVAAYTEGVSPWQEVSRYLIAGLFAMHPPRPLGAGRVERFPNESLGDAFARLAPRGSARRDAVERRFTQLLAADRDELPDQLRQAISLLQAGDVAVNWQFLLWDVDRWEEEAHTVQRRWARAFWKLPKKIEEGDDGESEDESEKVADGGEG